MRNEAEGLPHTLESVKNLVDEIVVAVDASNEDNSREVAEKWLREWDETGKRWKLIDGLVLEDVGFAKARNHALEQVESDWVLVLDADETFPEQVTLRWPGPGGRYVNRVYRCHEHVRALLGQIAPEIDMVVLTLVMLNDDGSILSHFSGERLIRKDKRFMRPMHNAIANAEKAAQADIAIIHNRKYRPKHLRDERGGQRIRMAEKFFIPAIEKDPEDSRSMFYLAGTYNDAGAKEKAIHYYEMYLESPKAWPHERYQAAIFCSRAYITRESKSLKDREADLTRAREIAIRYIKDNWSRAEAYQVLGDIAQERHDWEEAIHWYQAAASREARLDPHFVEAATHTWLPRLSLAKCYYAAGNTEEGEKWLAEAIASEAPEDMLEYVRRTAIPRYGPIKRLAVFIDRGDDKFIKPLLEVWKDRYQVVVCTEPKGVKETLEWAKGGAAWFEWAGPMLIEATKLAHECRMIVRVHGYEVHSGFIPQVNWKRVDNVIFVADYLRQMALQQAPDLNQHCLTHIVPGGVQVEEWTVAEGKQGSKIAMAGYINQKKNIPLALDILYAAKRERPELELHICGERQDSREWVYIQTKIQELGLVVGRDVFFEPWQTNLNAWYADKDYYLSTSREESLHYALAEAMAAGLKPVVHCWRSSRDFYPSEYIFRTIEEALPLLLQKPTATDRQKYRNWVSKRLHFRDQLADIDLILARPTVAIPAPDAKAWRFEVSAAEAIASLGFAPDEPREADILLACGGGLPYLELARKNESQKRILWYAEQIAGRGRHATDRRKRVRPFIKRADMVVVSSPNSKPVMEAMGAKDVRVVFQGGARPGWQKRVPKPKSLDVSFFGVASPRRTLLIEKLGKELVKHDYGKVQAITSYDQEVLADLTHRSRIALNIHINKEPNVETRIAEVLASGTFLLTEKLPEGHPFPDGLFVEWSTPEELIEKALHYLKHEREREAIAARGCEWVWQNMTVGHQIERLLEACECRWLGVDTKGAQSTTEE